LSKKRKKNEEGKRGSIVLRVWVEKIVKEEEGKKNWEKSEKKTKQKNVLCAWKEEKKNW
jgi:hypothetical protein